MCVCACAHIPDPPPPGLWVSRGNRPTTHRHMHAEFALQRPRFNGGETAEGEVRASETRRQTHTVPAARALITLCLAEGLGGSNCDVGTGTNTHIYIPVDYPE